MNSERQGGKPEIGAQKRTLKLAPAIGDWTTYKAPKVLVRKIKSGLYGFDRLSLDELDQVLLIHYRFVQQLLHRFKVDLGMAVELYQVQVEQTTYLNFLRTLTGPVVQCRLDIPGLHDPVLFFLQQVHANSIINFALGSVDLEPINRPLTEAEKGALTATLNEYLALLSGAYLDTVRDLSLRVISSPDVVMDSTINPNSTLACFSADASLADNPAARLMVAYPGSTLKNLLARYRQAELAREPDLSRLPAALLARLKSPVSAQLGETTLTTTELQCFEVGDVVSLETTISSPVSVTIGEELKLLCQPGLKNNKRSARIVGLRESAEIELPPPALQSDEPAKAPAPLPAPLPEDKPAQPASQPANEPTPQPPAPPATEPVEEEELTDEDFTEEDLFSEEEDLGEEFPEDKFPENGL